MVSVAAAAPTSVEELRSLRGVDGRSVKGGMGEDLLAVLDAVVPDGPVVLVGHSMGGMTVVALAEEHPETAAAEDTPTA